MKFFYIIFALLLSFTLLLSSFELTFFLFHSPFDSTIVEPKAHSLTWIYLLEQKYITFIDLDIFTIHEKRHLLDVKRLFENIHSVWITVSVISLSLVIFLYFRAKERLILVFRYSFFIGLMVVALSILLAFDFLNSFKFLHQLLFLEHSWIFPDDSILIEWFPLSYFQEFVVIVISIFFMFLLFLKSLHSLDKNRID
ncbi:DUF1461 domain-containing protein [Sulfurovum sp. bin170]|uniref:lipoprotein intramolecular transacylase Lit n=1 Tax=Sulfurovum sp. bin170 TaxID=2695268 RepID=UPI0013DEC875|nr:DUF1461 domain-containing protein [Sulfurovum sp. bin170]NEW59822.1 DUF1461 domain-containing protein [Sulfurovum sp. bin170]